MPSMKPIKRPYGEHTKAFRLYEKLFVEWEGSFPHYVCGLPRGSAINLAMALNKCNIQEAQRNGLTSEMITLSAKARDVVGLFGEAQQKALAAGGQLEGENTWCIEISENQRHQRARNQSNFMDQLLEQYDKPAEAPMASATDAAPDAGCDPTQDDAFLAALAKFSKG